MSPVAISDGGFLFLNHLAKINNLYYSKKSSFTTTYKPITSAMFEMYIIYNLANAAFKTFIFPNVLKRYRKVLGYMTESERRIKRYSQLRNGWKSEIKDVFPKRTENNLGNIIAEKKLYFGFKMQSEFISNNDSKNLIFSFYKCCLLFNGRVFAEVSDLVENPEIIIKKDQIYL